MTFAATGVDGCHAGWFFVSLGSRGQMQCDVVRELGKLVRCAGESDRIFVDIPIGLPDGPEGRACDRAVREVLGKPRASSVFPAPARAVLGASDHEDAKRRSREATRGKAVSVQTFAIVSKIRAVDALLRRDAKARRLVREIHPEVCFWALNGCKPMKHSKKKKAGFRERLDVLERIRPTAGREIAGGFITAMKAFIADLRALPPAAGGAGVRLPKGVARDDAVDAMVAAVTAAHDAAVLRTLPPCPLRDSPMEMVYAGRTPGRT